MERAESLDNNFEQGGIVPLNNLVCFQVSRLPHSSNWRLDAATALKDALLERCGVTAKSYSEYAISQERSVDRVRAELRCSEYLLKSGESVQYTKASKKMTKDELVDPLRATIYSTCSVDELEIRMSVVNRTKTKAGMVALHKWWPFHKFEYIFNSQSKTFE